MPITSSAKKALRQNIRRRTKNAAQKKTLRELLKKYRELAASNKAEATKLVGELYQKLDKAAKANLITRNKAARLKSRLTKRLKTKA